MPSLSRRAWAGILAFLLVVGFSALALRERVPYATFSPGPTVNVLGGTGGAGQGAGEQDQDIIEVSGHPSYDDGGALRLVTVILSPPRKKIALPNLLRAWLNRDVAVYPYNAVYPPDATQESQNEQSTALMTSSQDTAVAAALRALDIGFHQAVKIYSVEKDGPSDGKLEPGDLLLAVDGTKVRTLEQVTGLVQPLPVGTRLTLRVQRDGQVFTRQVTTAKSPQDPTKSALLVNVAPSYRFPFTVDLNVDEHIGGSSGGLIFAMAIYDKLTPGSLTGGRAIAGTGEIDAAGDVRPIGGIQQKIVGAQDDGARLFLVPAGNCAEAAQAHYDPDKIRLVKVTTLSGALRDVRTWVRDRDASLPRCAA